MHRGFYNIFPICQHQGAGGQLWLATELAGANLWIETPNESRPHWWGDLPPEDQPPAPNIAVSRAIVAGIWVAFFQRVPTTVVRTGALDHPQRGVCR